MATTKGECNIWLIDDSRSFLSVTESILTEAGHSVHSFENPGEALSKLRVERPSFIISDIMMPGIDGIELLKRVRNVEPDLPVVLVSASANLDIACQAIRAGVFEILTKPVRKSSLLRVTDRAAHYCMELSQRDSCQNELERTVMDLTRQFNSTLIEVKIANLETVEVLSKVAEYRDGETAQHNRRIGFYSYTLASEMGMSPEFCEEIVCAAPMHDIGKIAMPDSLLLKTCSLSREEFEVMQTHTTIGARMLECGKSNVLKMAHGIALSHHEKWDGSGYPSGIQGDRIPIAGRIVSVADHYDALRSWRPYKGPYTHEETLSIMTKGSGRTRPEHFDPEVLSAFVNISYELAAIFDDEQDRCGRLAETIRAIHN